MNNHEEFTKTILGYYTRNGFGRVLKAEIDNAVFHYYILENIDKKYIDNGNIKYFNIDKSEIYRLSMKMRMTENRFKRFLEEDFFQHRESVREKRFLLEMVNSTSIKKNGLKEGKIRLLIPNPVVKKYLEERIYSIGSVIEYGQNREIIFIEIYDFLKLVEFDEDKKIGDIIRYNILAKSDSADNTPEIKEFFHELNKIPMEERLKKIATGFANKLIGKAGDEIIGAIFDSISDG